MSTNHPLPKRADRITQLRRWAFAQSRPAATHFMRGVCYGAGTLAATLFGLWL
ncbi:hypothetical protein PZB75_30150 [Streptomyces sp. AM 4-1-1]|uniref:hypothetical protein n=1 Tax=Streptomyces sp. AM 4-1-1 TaxID=3028710 RepID=UPI0023B8B29B|nr:hypothetical protein [Streptomyces sp. AM 4-1-1]WEH37253.1 hypothetical protein PZB75_30150 [Streptomyces sp. AM 4-1-1]